MEYLEICKLLLPNSNSSVIPMVGCFWQVYRWVLPVALIRSLVKTGSEGWKSPLVWCDPKWWFWKKNCNNMDVGNNMWELTWYHGWTKIFDVIPLKSGWFLLLPSIISKWVFQPSRRQLWWSHSADLIRSLKWIYISKHCGIPKSSISKGFSIINHPFWSAPILGNIHIATWLIHAFNWILYCDGFPWPINMKHSHPEKYVGFSRANLLCVHNIGWLSFITPRLLTPLFEPPNLWKPLGFPLRFLEAALRQWIAPEDFLWKPVGVGKKQVSYG